MSESWTEEELRSDSTLGRRDFLHAVSAAGVGVLAASRAAIPGAQEPPQTGEGVFALGDFRLQSGTILRNAKLAYKTHGHSMPTSATRFSTPRRLPRSTGTSNG